jgi:hypothetical protein
MACFPYCDQASFAGGKIAEQCGVGVLPHQPMRVVVGTSRLVGVRRVATHRGVEGRGPGQVVAQRVKGTHDGRGGVDARGRGS